MIEDDYRPAGAAGAERWCFILSGCSGGGKSSLLAALARRGHRTIPEPGRQIVKEQLLIEGPALPWRNEALFAELAASRLMHIYNTLGVLSAPVFFDRSLVDAAAWAGAPAHLRRAAALYRFNPKVFLVPPWPEIYRNDPERRHSFEDAVGEYEALRRNYGSYGYDTVIVPRSPVAERADFIEAQIAES